MSSLLQKTPTLLVLKKDVALISTIVIRYCYESSFSNVRYSFKPYLSPEVKTSTITAIMSFTVTVHSFKKYGRAP
jgi:hypothetical protein